MDDNKADIGQVASLPVAGTDWVDGFYEKYIIVSLKFSLPDMLKFWKPKGLGYTKYLFAAGLFEKWEIEQDIWHYNDGINAVAVPLTETAMGDFTTSTIASLGIYANQLRGGE